MDVEYAAFLKNKTWHLVPPEKWRNVIYSKWVFKVKTKFNGSIYCHKARLVTKGFLVLSVALSNGWSLR
jgi:hypothetical protein